MEAKSKEIFTDKAGIYHKFRASYPSDLIKYLYSRAGFDCGSIIADIGSGTGIFSRLLLEMGSQVYCVEPNDDMRLIAETELRDKAGYGKFISVNASAENTGLREKSVDFVTSAQAFHWFNRSSFQVECRRILKQGGKVALIWNTRDYEDEMVKKDYDIRKNHSIDIKGLGEGGGPPKDCTDFFWNGVCEEMTFRNDLILDRETYVGMNLTRSYSPRADKEPEKYHSLVKELHLLFDQYNINGVLYYPHITKSYLGHI
jgi:ubiquinone/menaquinone biosynthesis C-methylase UbiE